MNYEQILWVLIMFAFGLCIFVAGLLLMDLASRRKAAHHRQ